MSTDWWRGATLYQVYPRSFADADGDGLGDLAGITQRLPYVASLGVDGIWVSPFYPGPMRDFGYDVADHCGVDPRLGTLADFDALVTEAHRLGLKVVIDQVWSHTAAEHPWFQHSRASRDNPMADWYVWADAKADGSPPTNWLSWMGGPAWRWEPRRRQYHLHHFLPQMPDLNFHCPAVQAAILDIARFWLDRGVDGFRLDTANLYAHDPQLRDNPPAPPGQRGDSPVLMQHHAYTMDQPESLAFLRRLRAVMDGYPDRMAVGEIGGAGGVGGTPGAMAAPGHGPVTWLALLVALRGTVFVYQGEELGLPQADVPFERLQDPYGLANWPLDPGRDGCRTPMPWVHDRPHAGFGSTEPWLPADPAHAALAVDLQEPDPRSTLNQARALIGLRQQQRALRTGSCDVLCAQGDLLVLRRTEGDEDLLAVFNLGTEAADVPTGLPPGALEPACCLWASHPLVLGRRVPAGAAAFYRIHR